MLHIEIKHTSRMETLMNRRERLIEANLLKDYVRKQPDRYFSCLLYIRQQMKIEHLRVNNIHFKK